MSLTGRLVEADEAMSLGIVHELVEPDQLFPRTARLADELAAGPPLAQRLVKSGFDRASSQSFEQSLAQEVNAQVLTLASDDVREGIRAFIEGRDPRFRGS